MCFYDLLIALILFFTGPVNASSSDWTAEEFVTLQNQPVITIEAGGQALALLSFRVRPDYHIMANQLKNENFLSSEIILAETTGIQFDKPQFPPSEVIGLAGSEEAIPVWSDVFQVEIPVVATAAAAKGVHAIPGFLSYQVCDNTKCYFPRELAFQITIQVE